MLLSGLQKCTLVDYPGNVACVVFTLGCNMRCRFCHNPEMVLPEKIRLLKHSLILEDTFFHFLESRVGKLDGVSICGGEPTIHKDLPEFCSRIKSLGFRVKLDTNGQNPEMLGELLEKKLVDYVAMDVKHTWGKYPSLIQIPIENTIYERSIKTIIKQSPDYEFRTTIIGRVHSEQDVEEISSYIQGAKHYYLQNYRGEVTLDPSFSGYSFSFQELQKFEKIALRNVEKCSIRI